MSKHGKFYWFVANGSRRTRKFAGRHKLAFGVLATLILLYAFALRPLAQPMFLFLRIYTFDIALVVLSLYLIRRFKHWMKWKSWVTVLLLLLVIVGTNFMSWTPHSYLTMYFRFVSIKKENIALLPETGFERIQPLNSMRVLANEMMTSNEQPSEPFNVRIGNDYRWTMGIEPSFFWSRLTGSVREVVNISSTTPTPNLSEGNRDDVNFSVGENLLLGKNSKICTIRSFGVARFLSYEPVDVKYLKDDSGEWVQIVSLLKWEGIIFPQPVFGGVQVIHQDKGGVLNYLKHMFVGDGEWISPKDIDKHAFLRGQNIVPYKVSRFAASSFRFHRGFIAPFWGYHQGDIRIPDLPGDLNDQPFTTYFKFDNGEGKLYHYFALEPYQDDKQGLSLSLLVPADGVGPVKIYDHNEKDETLIGVSAVAGQVKASRKMYDWSHSRPAENRPYIRTINGKRQFFWLTTIVTSKGDDTSESGGFVAGSTPDVVLTDPFYRVPVWVDSQHPETWVLQLERDLASVWRNP